jgi:hypothetical protein
MVCGVVGFFPVVAVSSEPPDALAARLNFADLVAGN